MSEIEISIDDQLDKIFEFMRCSNEFHIEKIKFFSNYSLVEEEEMENINKVIKKLLNMLDGPPAFIIQLEGEDKPIFDTYVETLLSEIASSISKVIASVKNVDTYHMFSFYGKYYEDKEYSSFLTDMYEKEFWEKTEIAYIRMASTWDRIGQLLSFIYFNIRQYDREGFLSTVQQIHINIIPMYEKLRISDSWKRVWKYSIKEDSEGLKWLLLRRNLIIHQVGLKDVTSLELSEERDLFDSLHNHILDNTIKKKLKPLSKEDEKKQILFHFRKLFNIINDIYSICEMGVEKVPRIK